MKRRVGIAQTLVNDPRVLIVDEPNGRPGPLVEDIDKTCRDIAVLWGKSSSAAPPPS